jgi:hypothetical protein
MSNEPLSKFYGMPGSLVLEGAEHVAGLTFKVQEDYEGTTEVHLNKEELLRLHAALGTYIYREGLAL